MSDFRIGSVFPADKFPDQQPPDSSKRKKPKRPEGQVSDPAEPSAEPVEDYYSPTRETEEPK